MRNQSADLTVERLDEFSMLELLEVLIVPVKDEAVLSFFGIELSNERHKRHNDTLR